MEVMMMRVITEKVMNLWKIVTVILSLHCIN